MAAMTFDQSEDLGNLVKELARTIQNGCYDF